MPTKQETLADFGIRNITQYATEVNLDRAIPELYDGLKPVLRRAAWSAHQFHSGEAVKSAKIVGQCFIAGTKVTLADGSRKNIEDCNIGDIVKTDKLDCKIVKTFENPDCKTMTLVFNDKSEITCTHDHIFYAVLGDTELEKRADELRFGDLLLAEHGLVKRVSGIRYQIEHQTTYCIEVEKRHRFYANGILVHNCIGSYHPHGDSSVYGAMQTMVHHNVPLLAGVGNWGTIIDPPAAYRYTNSFLNKFGNSVFDANYKAVMDTVPNFDNSTTEPVVLPVRLPLLVLNGGEGIGVGITSSIPTFTLDSVVEVLNALFSGKKLTAKDYARILKPKQHWGGHLVKSEQNKKAWLDLMETGRAQVQFEPTLEIDEAKKTITISEWPAKLDPVKFIQKVKQIPEVQRAQNSKGSTTFTIETKKGYNLTQFQALVAKVRKLSITAESYRLNVTHRISQTVDGVTSYDTKFLALSIPEFFETWCKLRLRLEKRSLTYQMNKQQEAIDYHELLIYAADHLPVIFKALKQKDSRGYLMSNLKLTEKQADQILDLKVRNLSKLDQSQLKSKLKDLKARMKELQGFYKKPKTKIKSEFPQLLSLINEDMKAQSKRDNQELTVK